MFRSQSKFLQFSIINFFCLLSVIESSPVQGKPYESNSPVIYRRYVRKRPSTYVGDSYMEEVHEIFETRYKPPQYIFDDDEIDQIIRCDFEPHLEECENLRKKQQNTPPMLPPKRPLPTKPVFTRPAPSRPVLAKPVPTRTSTVPFRPYETTPRPTTTTSTTKPNKPTPAIDLTPPSTNDIDGIPTLPPDSEEYEEFDTEDVNTKEPVSYEEETTDENFTDDYDEVKPQNSNNESNYDDTEIDDYTN